MKHPFGNYVRKLLCFALLPLLAVTAAEVWLRAQPGPARYKHEWMTSSADRVGTLVLGSSHTYYGIEPEVLGDDAFSLALPSQTYRYDLALLRRYRMPRLKTVIVPLSYFSLHEDLETVSREPHTAVRYRIYMDVDEHPRLSVYGFETAHPAAVREKLKRALSGERMKWSRSGQGLDFRPVPDGKPVENGRERAEANTYGAAGAAFDANFARLEQMAAWCAARGVRLVLLTTPVSAAFREACDTAQLQTVARAEGRLLACHPEILRLDYSADSRFCAADFYDADHLNTRGARKLSRLIAARLRQAGGGSRPAAPQQVFGKQKARISSK